MHGACTWISTWATKCCPSRIYRFLGSCGIKLQRPNIAHFAPIHLLTRLHNATAVIHIYQTSYSGTKGLLICPLDLLEKASGKEEEACLEFHSCTASNTEVRSRCLNPWRQRMEQGWLCSDPVCLACLLAMWSVRVPVVLGATLPWALTFHSWNLNSSQLRRKRWEIALNLVISLAWAFSLKIIINIYY